MITIICLIVGKLPLPQIHTSKRRADESDDREHEANYTDPEAGLSNSSVCG